MRSCGRRRRPTRARRPRSRRTASGRLPTTCVRFGRSCTPSRTSGLSVLRAGARLQLRAEHDRADLQRRLLQLGHDDRRLERADRAVRVLADDDLDREAAGRQRDAGLIEHLLAGRASCRRPPGASASRGCGRRAGPARRAPCRARRARPCPCPAATGTAEPGTATAIGT